MAIESGFKVSSDASPSAADASNDLPPMPLPMLIWSKVASILLWIFFVGRGVYLLLSSIVVAWWQKLKNLFGSDPQPENGSDGPAPDSPSPTPSGGGGGGGASGAVVAMASATELSESAPTTGIGEIKTETSANLRADTKPKKTSAKKLSVKKKPIKKKTKANKKTTTSNGAAASESEKKTIPTRKRRGIKLKPA